MSLSPDDEAKAAYWDAYLAPDAEFRDRPRRRGGGGSSGGCLPVLGCLAVLPVIVGVGLVLAAPSTAAFLALHRPQLVARVPATWVLAACAPVAWVLIAWRNVRWRPWWRPIVIRIAVLAAGEFAAGYAAQSYFAGQISAWGDPRTIWLVTNGLGVVVACVPLMAFSRIFPREVRVA